VTWNLANDVQAEARFAILPVRFVTDSQPARGNAARLIRKLEHGTLLSTEEKQALEAACLSELHFAPRSDVVKQGDPTQFVNIILAGFACRYRLLADGRRQIVGLLIPGDMCDVRVCVLKKMDHSIGALSSVGAVQLTRESIESLMSRFPRLARALWWSTLVEESITREWVVNVGHRTAAERIAHLFCETFERMRLIGLATANSCEFPLTQAELGDALSLSAVHVNRVLMEMRRNGLITLRNQRLTVHDYAALRSVAGFDSGYLHLDGVAREEVCE
jgi:CRP-like cAMP-binding protein